MGGAFRILTLGGIPILVHASWLVIYALITWTLAVGYFPRVLPDLPPFTYWLRRRRLDRDEATRRLRLITPSP